jgi:hypothetical protein
MRVPPACTGGIEEVAMTSLWRGVVVAGLTATLLVGVSGVGTARAASTFLGGKHPTEGPSTVPANGDVNPYGLVVVPRSVGSLRRGSTLVSNFNNKGNLQGTGTTIVQISPAGQRTVFAHITLTSGQRCPGGVGLTTALAVFRSGWVVVGSLPTADGTSATEEAGCLIVLNSNGRVAETIAGGDINGPWDMTSTQVGGDGILYVTNVLNGLDPAAPPTTIINKGTVVRVVLALAGLKPRVESESVIASGFPERNDPAALVVGPTGVGLGGRGAVLYVASTVNNRISAVPAPLLLPGPVFGTGFTVTRGGNIDQPLGLTVAPNGDIVTVNGANGLAVETAPLRGQVAKAHLDTTGSPPGAGALFGIAITANRRGLEFVDDATNTLNLLN